METTPFRLRPPRIDLVLAHLEPLEQVRAHLRVERFP